MKNLELYLKLKDTPKEAQKSFNNGRFSGTDINPMYRIKRLTEEFGPCGLGWYYEITEKWIEPGTDGSVACFVNINLYVKYGNEWSKPIQGTGGNMFIQKNSRGLQTNDEAYKMALTDALSVSCKALGLGADIYFANDRTKYDTPKEPAVLEETSKELLNEISKANDVETLRIIWNKYPQFQRNQEFKLSINNRKKILNDGNIKTKNYD